MTTEERHEPKFDFERIDAEHKLKELILYVAQECEQCPAFGRTKLNKILWYADTLAFALDGQPITGVEYMRLPKGPVVHRMLPVKRELEQSGDVREVLRSFGGYPQKRLLALRPPDLTLFSSREISLVDRAIRFFWDSTATQDSDKSHEMSAGWRIARDGDRIPYEAVFVSTEGCSEDDRLRAQELIREHEWQV